jgi:hypothetical protein
VLDAPTRTGSHLRSEALIQLATRHSS